jgi:MYXO-CTERM domain-containing protein
MAFRLRMGLLPAVSIALLAVSAAGEARANLPLTGPPTTVDFDTFTGTGFDPAPMVGQLDSDEWVVRGVSDGDLAFGGSGTTGDYANGQSGGDEANGGVWAFNTGASVGLGANLTTPDLTPGSFVLRLRNDTGQDITALEVAYTIWTNNLGDQSDSFAFAWSLDDATYTTVGSLGFNTPGAGDALGWISAAHSTTISGIDVADGENIYLRWSFDGPGGAAVHDEFAIDDIELALPPAICGNGTPEGGEECDDGNMSNTDACVEGCLDASCGDGFLWAGMEGCDDGNMDNTDACPDGAGGTCQDAVCGDGFTYTGMEECDDANNDDTDACVAGCVAATCGDGFEQDGVEACDDGNMDNTDACPDGAGGTCEDAVCGDGFTFAGMEECDDANGDDEDACANDCTINPMGTTTEPTTTGTTTGDTDGTTDATTSGTTMGVDDSGTSSGADTTGGPEETTTGGPGTTDTPTSTASGSASGSTSGSTSATTDPTGGSTGDTDSGGFSGEEPPGCGCRSGGGPSWLLLAFVMLGALRRTPRPRLSSRRR